MALAAGSQKTQDSWTIPAPPPVAPGPVHCVLWDERRLDRDALRRLADASRHEILFFESAGLEETRALLAAGQADILVLDARIESALALARELAGAEQTRAIPVIYVTDEMDAANLMEALRAGVADCLHAGEMTPEGFDQAITNALRRVEGTGADQQALIGNLRAENETLRRVAVRNMRLLKNEAMPLLALTWRLLQSGGVEAEQRTRTAKGLGRITRNMTGLIDDTVIVAATHRAHDTDEAVALNALIDEILKDDLGEIASSHAHIVVHDLPVLRARRAHMAMLFEELLLTAVRNSRIGEVPEVEIGAGADPDGNPIIWFRERGLQLSARKQGLALRGALGGLKREDTDAHSWSLCQRLVEKNNGVFRIVQEDDGSSRLMMRFPQRTMLAGVSPSERQPAVR